MDPQSLRITQPCFRCDRNILVGFVIIIMTPTLAELLNFRLQQHLGIEEDGRAMTITIGTF